MAVKIIDDFFRLKTCPFCNGDKLMEKIDGTTGKHSVTCIDCGAVGPTGNTTEEAASKWNIRIVQ